jgi:hypothetical protein
LQRPRAVLCDHQLNDWCCAHNRSLRAGRLMMLPSDMAMIWDKVRKHSSQAPLQWAALHAHWHGSRAITLGHQYWHASAPTTCILEVGHFITRWLAHWYVFAYCC